MKLEEKSILKDLSSNMSYYLKILNRRIHKIASTWYI